MTVRLVKTITTDQLIMAINRAIKARGDDHVYPDNKRNGTTCRYWHEEDNEAGCLIGYVLHDTFGVSAEMLMDHERQAASSLIIRTTGGPDSFETLDFADQIQHYQDNEHSWGDALRLAIDAL